MRPGRVRLNDPCSPWPVTGHSDRTQLRQRDIECIILCGLTTNTCVDSTGRDATEQGFEVTFVSDAVAPFSMEMHRATIELNRPRYAAHVRTTDELIKTLA